MKTLKFSRTQSELITKGLLTKTWRINDDKNISVDDKVRFIDKSTGKVFAVAVIDKVVVKRFTEIALNDIQGTEELIKYYGAIADPSLHVKIISFTLTPAENSTQVGQLYPVFKELKLYSDGGSRGNPGPSASGYVLMTMDDTVVKKDGTYLGITTNNQAEYQSLKAGLEEAKKYQANVVHVYMDSMLVVNQMKGTFKVKNRDLWPIHQSIKDLVASSFALVDYTHVPRELNKLADSAVNEVLDASLKH